MAEIDYGMQIAVLDRGWVYVGKCTVNAEWLIIADARNVRRWGTTKGLGELAQSGPLKTTVLDTAGTVRVPMAGLKHLIACEPSKWT